MGVSRSVVREAVAALRSDGLVVTRQGAGAFAASDPARVPFRIDAGQLSSPAGIVQIMELRLAVEVEASAMAAERATAAELKGIERALAAIERAIRADQPAIDEPSDRDATPARRAGRCAPIWPTVSSITGNSPSYNTHRHRPANTPIAD